MGENAGLWVRVSSGQQDEASQVPEVERYCQQHGYKITRRYQLHDRSAYHGEQQQKLDEMLTDVREGRIRVLVCWHSDRLERRGGLALLNLLAAVKDAGGRIESTKEPLLGHVDMGGQVATFLGGVIANEKSVHLSDQVRISHDTIRANGGLVGRPPFGYTSTGPKMNRRLVPTDDGRRLIPEIFARVIAGESLGTIAEWLSVETGKAWWAKSVGVIVRNPVYMGHRCAYDVATRTYGQTLHRCEGLVDAASWKRAGAALDTRPKRGPQIVENRAQLAGVLFCPACQTPPFLTASPMYRITTRSGVFYRCAGRGANRQGCGNMVRLDEADRWVDQKIIKEWNRPIMERKIIPGHDHSGEIEAIRFEIRQLGTMDLDDAEYDARLIALRRERDRLVMLPAVPDQVQEVETGENYAEQWAALTSSERAAFLKKHHIMVMFSRDERAITWRT